MALSTGSIDTLMQLLEAKLGTVEVFDREDAKVVKVLEQCRNELAAYRGKRSPATKIHARRRSRIPEAPAAPI
jgi:hypothetical protein